MILKRIFDEYNFQIEPIIIKEYKRLNLTFPESIVLMALFSIYRKRKTFSILAISRRVEFNQAEIGEIVDSLINKQFLQVELEVKDDKTREVFNLDKVFEKIEALFIEDQKEKNILQKEQDIKITIKAFENGMGRLLKTYELENIRRWYEDDLYTHDDIMIAIERAQNRLSVKYVERILSQEKLEKIEVDQETEKALESLFKAV
jgi:DNA replication protein